MRIDKSQIKPILEGQTGREVADNLQLNFEYLADKGNEIDSDVAQKWGTAKFGGILEGEVTVLQQSINDLVTEENVFFYKDRFVFQKLSGFSSSYCSNAQNGSTYNEDGGKAKSKTYFVFENKQYYFNGTDLVLISVDVDDDLSATSTNAVQNKVIKKEIDRLDKEVNDYNISGINGGAKYKNLLSAIMALDTYLNDVKKVVGVKVTFVSGISNNSETWSFKGGVFMNTNSWSQYPLGGPNRELYESVGAKFNEITGFYELNGLNDITEKQMACIYSETNQFTPTLQPGLYAQRSFRTNLTSSLYTIGENINADANNLFRENIYLEILKFNTSSSFYRFHIKSMSAIFYNCIKLRKVIGAIVLTMKKQSDSYFLNAFDKCISLEDIEIFGISANLSFADCEKLSKNSILYMIQNSIAESPITITLHPTAYTMAMADNEIQTALGEKSNVSLKDGGAQA